MMQLFFNSKAQILMSNVASLQDTQQQVNFHLEHAADQETVHPVVHAYAKRFRPVPHVVSENASLV